MPLGHKRQREFVLDNNNLHHPPPHAEPEAHDWISELMELDCDMSHLSAPNEDGFEVFLSASSVL